LSLQTETQQLETVDQAILHTNKSPPSSMGGKFTRDGFTNNLSKRAVTRCSKTLCTYIENIINMNSHKKKECSLQFEQDDVKHMKYNKNIPA
jgi:hypothetical protein